MARALSIKDDPRFAKALAPEGSPAWADLCREKLQAALDRELDGAIKFSVELASFVEQKGWRALSDADGKPFVSLEAFAMTKRPDGLGCTPARFKILMHAIRALQDRKPLGKHGTHTDVRAKDGSFARGDNITSGADRPRGTSAEYLEARLERDFPEVFQAYQDGKYRSARAAGRAAGIVAPHDPVKAALSEVRKMNDQQRELFVIELRALEVMT